MGDQVLRRHVIPLPIFFYYRPALEHTDLDTWQASLYCPVLKSCCQKIRVISCRYILLWLYSLVMDEGGRKMITRQWTLMISCCIVNVVNRVGYSNGILQIDGGSSSSVNGAKTSSGSSQILRVSPQTLVYLELSPDFCRTNATAGKVSLTNFSNQIFYFRH